MVTHHNQNDTKKPIDSTTLVESAADGDWLQVADTLEQNHSADCCDSFGMFPLHWACTDSKIDYDIFQLILTCYPLACRQTNLSGMLPLHIAITNKLPGFHLKSLLEHYPQAALVVDGATNKSPMELAHQHKLAAHSVKLIKQTVQDLEGADFIEKNNVAGELRKLTEELKRLSFEVRGSSCPTVRSSLSSVSSSGSLNEMVNSSNLTVDWNPKRKLGLTFTSVENNPAGGTIGAKVNRVTGKTETPGVETLEPNDLLIAIDDKPIRREGFEKISMLLKKMSRPCRLSFSRTMFSQSDLIGKASFASLSSFGSQDSASYCRMSSLLEETLQKVSSLENSVARISSANSFSDIR